MRPDAHALVAAYAAGALEAQDQADVRAHLAVCPVCQEDLRGFEETLGSLAAATAEAPPARLRQQVMARVRTTPQLPPQHGPDAAPEQVGPDGAPPAPAAVPPRRAGGVDRALFALVASVLAVAAIGAGAWGVLTADRLADVRAQQAAVQRVLSAEDLVTLAGTPTLSGGLQADEVVVLASRDADAALLLPAGLPAAPEGRTWQAWVVGDDGAVSAGTFDTRGGEAVALSAGLQGAAAVAVSLEPRGGSSAPTTDPVLVLPLDA